MTAEKQKILVLIFNSGLSVIAGQFWNKVCYYINLFLLIRLKKIPTLIEIFIVANQLWQDYFMFLLCDLICSLSKKIFMGNLLYIIAVILIIGWLLGMFAFNAGGFIHTLLVIAIILFLVKLLGGRSSI